ncbi:MAG: ROK family transcriptional regulator [Phreatobacter sp.]|uniref:ROK family transcriptional regulator n=1 Tax=Phreatobacter sp. TaxID=1966341 RepID=UPI001A63D6C0|nr:ROK family transcriptional regulator [Phreatobacter sp.]MBL8571302.1 ROK family transcriptional regulator [Phreatobacter sp.]
MFAAMLEKGAVSRAELSRLTGLSKQTTSEIAKVLEGAGWIRLCGQTQGAVGRRATTYELDERSAYVVGVDLGGTKVNVAVASLLGTIVGEATLATDRRGGLHVVRQIKDVMLDVAAKGGVDPSLIRCGAVGSPGVVQPATGQIHLAPNIPGLDVIDVAGELGRALGFPVVIENDVNVAAVGERQQGERRHVMDMAFIALGTGIGMGIVANGQLIQGSRGGAGEIAYLPIGGDPFDSRGFRLGTLETAIGSAAIVDRFRSLGGEADDVRGVFDRLDAGDPAAAMTIDETARIFVHAIMAVRAVLDPEIIVLGGSIGARAELLERVRTLAARFLGSRPAIEKSLLGSRAVLVGAVELAVSSLQRSLFDPFAPAPDARFAPRSFQLNGPGEPRRAG